MFERAARRQLAEQQEQLASLDALVAKLNLLQSLSNTIMLCCAVLCCVAVLSDVGEGSTWAAC